MLAWNGKEAEAEREEKEMDGRTDGRQKGKSRNRRRTDEGDEKKNTQETELHFSLSPADA